MSYPVQYLGFVYIKSKEGLRKPGLGEVRQASRLLSKPKKAHDVHPLFACGFETMLTLRLGKEGVIVTVQNEDGEDLIVMDHPMHKVSFVVSVRKIVFMVARHDLRGRGVMFKCHGFKAKNSSMAANIAQHMATECNNIFKKLRQTRTFLRNRSAVRGTSLTKQKDGDSSVRLRDKTSDTAELRRLIAMTRVSVMEGKPLDEVSNVTEEQTREADKMMETHQFEEDSLADILKQLQVGISEVDDDDAMLVARLTNDALLSTNDMSLSSEDEEEEEPEENQFSSADIDFEEFADDFARMTMFLHDDFSAERHIPKYADITLDSDLFEMSYI